jgi:hypothetical protein
VGLFSKKVAESEVWFSGIQAFAESGQEEAVISAQVQLTEKGRLAGKEPLSLLGPLGATRLLSMLRREDHYVIPFMTMVESVAQELEEIEGEPTDFSVRGCVVTDPEMLSMMVGASASAGGPWAGDSMRTAELNSSLPSTVERLNKRLPGPSERTTSLAVHEARNGAASVRFKFNMSASNALTTIGAWAATVDHLVTQRPREEMATPIEMGLKALYAIWTELGNPLGVSVADGTQMEALVADVTTSHIPD